jgi:phenylacetate-CoA ligase
MTKVPYYRDILTAINFKPAKLRDDFSYFQEIPFLTKDILIEQGHRMIREDSANYRSHVFKTGGSTGKSALIYYDQEALDWSSAVTLYARNRIGHKNWKSEVHFASRFPEEFPLRDRIKENIKCFIMNRSNVFFDSLDDESLGTIWARLKQLRPNLVHAHPSTIYALAIWAKKNNKTEKLFNVFESSGELLDAKKRSAIAEALRCEVVDRYGLAEFGVVAYQFGSDNDFQVFDSFVFPEAELFGSELPSPELVFTGLTNYFMPLIRYRTGDRGELMESDKGIFIRNITGRIHDFVLINNKQYPTHYVQDVLDRVGGVLEFQVLDSGGRLRLNLVPEGGINEEAIVRKIREYWGDAFEINFVDYSDLVSVGWRDKFRYVVNL